jgi:hypothetical protein
LSSHNLHIHRHPEIHHAVMTLLSRESKTLFFRLK